MSADFWVVKVCLGMTPYQLARATEWVSILDHPGISKEIANQQIYQPEFSSVLTAAWHLLQVLAYLEQYHVIHGNIQPETVVGGSRPQLANFGSARLYCGMWSSNFGLNQVYQPYQPAYRAPEIWANEHYDCRTDIWALGCLLYRWATGQDFMGPFIDNIAGTPQPADQATFNNQILDIDVRLSLVQLPAGLTSLIQQMLDLDKITRPFASELLKSAVFAGRSAERGDFRLSYPYPLTLKQSLEQRQALVSAILKEAKAVLVLSEADNIDVVGDATTTQVALALQSLVLADVLLAEGYSGSPAELAKEVVYLLTGLAGFVTEIKLNPAVINYATLNYYSSSIRSIASNYLRLVQYPAWVDLDVSTALQSLLEFTELQGLVILPIDTLT